MASVSIILILLGIVNYFALGTLYTVPSIFLASWLIVGNFAVLVIGAALGFASFSMGRKIDPTRSKTSRNVSQYLSLALSITVVLGFAGLFAVWVLDLKNARERNSFYVHREEVKAQHYKQIMNDPTFLARLASEFRFSYEAIGPRDAGETRIVIDGTGSFQTILKKDGIENVLVNGNIPPDRAIDLRDAYRASLEHGLSPSNVGIDVCHAMLTKRAMLVSDKGRTDCYIWDQDEDRTRQIYPLLKQMMNVYIAVEPKSDIAKRCAIENYAFFALVGSQ